MPRASWPLEEISGSGKNQRQEKQARRCSEAIKSEYGDYVQWVESFPDNCLLCVGAVRMDVCQASKTKSEQCQANTNEFYQCYAALGSPWIFEGDLEANQSPTLLREPVGMVLNGPGLQVDSLLKNKDIRLRVVDRIVEKLPALTGSVINILAKCLKRWEYLRGLIKAGIGFLNDWTARCEYRRQHFIYLRFRNRLCCLHLFYRTVFIRVLPPDDIKRGFFRHRMQKPIGNQ